MKAITINVKKNNSKVSKRVPFRPRKGWLEARYEIRDWKKLRLQETHCLNIQHTKEVEHKFVHLSGTNIICYLLL
jgi:hypothetical protein